MKQTKPWEFVSHHPVGKQIRGYNRGFLTMWCKKPLRLALVAIAKKWPEPTRENSAKPNTQILFDIWEEFNKHQVVSEHTTEMFNAAFKIFICTYEAHQYYSQRFDWVMSLLLKSGWDTRDNNPSKVWEKEDA